MSARARYALWAAGLLTDAASALAMLAPGRRVPLNTSHLADRFRLFTLIVLGESVARLISAAGTRPWSLPLAVVLAAALITLAALRAQYRPRLRPAAAKDQRIVQLVVI